MAKDISNQRFSKLVAIEKVGRSGSNNIWKCICDCGNTTNTTTTSLILGGTRSCGCLIVETMKLKRKSIVGEKYSFLTVIEDLPSEKGRRVCMVRCDCGNEKKVQLHAMRYGKIKSCGCYLNKTRVESATKHGLSRNRLYFVWKSMLDRCYNKNFKHYKNYGGRGISVDERWHKLENFVEDVSLGYRKGLELDRIDNNGNYSKYNFRWSTKSENNMNKRNTVYITYNNERKTAKDWCKLFGLNYNSVLGRNKIYNNAEEVLFGKKLKLKK